MTGSGTRGRVVGKAENSRTENVSDAPTGGKEFLGWEVADTVIHSCVGRKCCRLNVYSSFSVEQKKNVSAQQCLWLLIHVPSSMVWSNWRYYTSIQNLKFLASRVDTCRTALVDVLEITCGWICSKIQMWIHQTVKKPENPLVPYPDPEKKMNWSGLTLWNGYISRWTCH